MDDQPAINIHWGGSRGNFVGFRDLDDYSRSTIALPINPTSKDESTRCLRLYWRYCNDDVFANIVEDWKDFSVPRFRFEVIWAAHFGPPPQSLAIIRHASLNSMQRWVYRLLTLKHCRLRPNEPICVSHAMAVLRLVQFWKLDGSQFCRLAAREELFDPVPADDVDKTCMYAREIMCDIVWLQLCRLRDERLSIERASRCFRAHVDDYLRYDEIESQVSSRVGSKKGPRGHRRTLTGTHFDRAAIRQSTIKEEKHRLSLGATVTTTNLENGNHTPLDQLDAQGKVAGDTTRKANRWSWSNPLKQMTKVRRKSSAKGQPPESLRSNEVIDTDRTLPNPPTNDMRQDAPQPATGRRH